jgi:hypothetical protein
MAIKAAFDGFDEEWFKALSETSDEAKAGFERYRALQRMEHNRVADSH